VRAARIALDPDHVRAKLPVGWLLDAEIAYSMKVRSPVL